MEAVAERMVLYEELRGERRVRIERYRGGAIQLVVGEPTNGFRCGLRVPTKEVESVAFWDGAVLTGVFRVDVRHVIPRDARDGLPVRELAGEIDFQRVHGCHVMDHHADRAAVGGTGVRHSASERPSASVPSTRAP